MARAIGRMRTPAGDAGWRVTGHAEVRRLLTDPRLGRSHPEPDAAAWYSRTDLSGRPTGNSAAEHEEHARWRRVVTRVFPPRRLERLRPRIEGLAGDLLDRLSAEGPEADFHAAISAVLPTLVICELLGVPLSDAGRFRRWTEEGAINTDIARSAKGMAELLLYVQELIRRRRLEPGDDVVSELLAAENEAPRAYERRVAKLLAGILAFGRETPGNAIDSGVLLLLSHPAQREALCRQPELAAGAVDEVLRCFPPSAATGGGLVRYAHADVDVDGALIGRGDMVLLDVVAANRDERVFPDPDRFDIRRAPNPHLTFGYGPHMCNFNGLARMEMLAVLAALFQRLPDLRLAVPAEELRFKSHLRTGGVVTLPVAW